MQDDTDSQPTGAPGPERQPAGDQVSAGGAGATAIKAGAGANVAVNNSAGVSIRDSQTGDITVQLPPAPGGLAALHQLRAPVADFVGRAGEIAELLGALGGGGAAVIGGAAGAGAGAGVGGLVGMGGIGKTELALVVAGRLRERYPDAQIVLTLQGSRDPALPAEEALRLVIRAFHPDARLPERIEELGALYRSLLTGRRVLILADDARDAAQVRPLLPPPGSALLVTSRRQFALPGMRRLDLGRLPEPEAVALLLAICPRLGAAEAGRLAAACGRLPLALRVSAGALAADPSMGIAGYLGRLADEGRRLAELRDEGAPDLDVEASLALSYDLLSAEARGDLLALGVCAASFDLAAGAAVLGMEPPEQAEARLSELCRRSLLEYVAAEGRYDLHELVRSFALARLGDEEFAARLRHARHYIAAVKQAQELYLAGGAGVAAGLALFDRERANLDAARRWLQAHSADEACARLLIDDADATVYTGDLRYDQRRERVPQLEAALAAARRLGRRDAEGWFLGNLGLAYNSLGDYPRAIDHHQQHLAIARELGNRQGEANALGNLGNAYYSLGDYPRAIDHHQQYLAIARELGDRQGEGNALGNLGLAYYSLGDYLRAIDHHQQHLAIARELGDRRGEGNALGNLGIAYEKLGDYPRAIDHHHQHLAIGRELGDRQGEANARWNLGVALVKQGEPARALPYLEAALAFYEAIGHPRAESLARYVEQVRRSL